MYTWYRFGKSGKNARVLSPEIAKESGAYIGEMKPDELAEELCKSKGWRGTDVLLIVKGEIITQKNSRLYTVGYWR